MNKKRRIIIYTLCLQLKRTKARRETWAAPAFVQAMRTSMGPAPLGSIEMGHRFVRPELPPWAEYSKASSVSSVTSDSSDTLNNCSVTSDGM